MSLMKCYWMLQNAIVTDLTFSELLRENQQGGKSHLVFEEDLTLWWIQLRNKNKITNIEPVVLRYSAKKQYWNVWSCCKSTGLQLYWKRHKCFSVKFAKIYRSSFSAEHLPVQNTSRWLLLNFLSDSCSLTEMFKEKHFCEMCSDVSETKIKRIKVNI